MLIIPNNNIHHTRSHWIVIARMVVNKLGSWLVVVVVAALTHSIIKLKNLYFCRSRQDAFLLMQLNHPSRYKMESKSYQIILQFKACADHYFGLGM